MHIHKLEKIWLILGMGCMFIFLSITGIQFFFVGHHNQASAQSVVLDPQKVEQTPPFDQPGLKKIGDHQYEADIIAMTFGYKPNKLTIPVGSTVTFKVTSKDVVHSFTIPGTDVNLAVTPGLVNDATYTFKKTGNILVLCNEYCGAGHQLMKMEVEVVNE
ncbi:MAG TPA: cytochrome c oxidase subunit II [Bacillota bacterium]|nr:cytochrome c oxidase subunit II [Bacillota bacterium]